MKEKEAQFESKMAPVVTSTDEVEAETQARREFNTRAKIKKSQSSQKKPPKMPDEFDQPGHVYAGIDDSCDMKSPAVVANSPPPEFDWNAYESIKSNINAWSTDTWVFDSPQDLPIRKASIEMQQLSGRPTDEDIVWVSESDNSPARTGSADDNKTLTLSRYTKRSIKPSEKQPKLMKSKKGAKVILPPVNIGETDTDVQRNPLYGCVLPSKTPPSADEEGSSDVFMY